MKVILKSGEVLNLKNIKKIIIDSRGERDILINAQLNKLKSGKVECEHFSNITRDGSYYEWIYASSVLQKGDDE